MASTQQKKETKATKEKDRRKMKNHYEQGIIRCVLGEGVKFGPNSRSVTWDELISDSNTNGKTTKEYLLKVAHDRMTQNRQMHARQLCNGATLPGSLPMLDQFHMSILQYYTYTTVLDMSGCIIDVEDCRIRAVNGHSAQAVVGSSGYEYMHPEVRWKIQALQYMYVNKGVVCHIVYPLLSPDNTFVFQMSSGSLTTYLNDAGEHVPGIVIHSKRASPEDYDEFKRNLDDEMEKAFQILENFEEADEGYGSIASQQSPGDETVVSTGSANEADNDVSWEVTDDQTCFDLMLFDEVPTPVFQFQSVQLLSESGPVPPNAFDKV